MTEETKPFNAKEEIEKILGENKIVFLTDSNQIGKNLFNYLDLISMGYGNNIFYCLKEFLGFKKPFGTYKIDFQDSTKKQRFLLPFEYGDINLEKLKGRITLDNLHDKYKELLYIEDTKRIDVVLATALSRKKKGIPIWLILVGPSGDMKSVQLNAIRNDDVFLLHNLTSKSLVNGYKNKLEHPDLAPLLKDKILIIPDMSQILKLPPIEKGELWGQLRDLYDGFAGKVSGQGSTAKYEGIKVTLIAGSTPAIDGQILINQDLGTRELIYRTSGSKNQEKVMRKCFENETSEQEITEELTRITTSYLEQTEIKDMQITEDILQKIMTLSVYITKMRATAEIDSYTNELRNIVYPEEPTRIAKQLKRIYVCLKSLNDNYPDEEAIKILEHIAKSSAFPVRVKLYEFLEKSPNLEFSTSEISDNLKIGKSTAKRECCVLENLSMISCRRKETSYPDKFYEYWKFKSNPSKDIVYSMIKDKDIVYTNIISSDGNEEKKDKPEFEIDFSELSEVKDE